MACFLVPAAEAVVVTAVAKLKKSRETDDLEKVLPESNGSVKALAKQETSRVPFSRKLQWLSYLLWGGAFLLAYEHIWHGEVVPWFPFLTAAANPADTAEMLHEMSTVGVSMAILVTAVWGIWVYAAGRITKRKRVVSGAVGGEA
ncbi:MAG: hypothetical protein LUG99_08395 [Lachnospiraceae bacterium]|nr:hypothetical protein [Lachnospiraceae bacterium]